VANMIFVDRRSVNLQIPHHSFPDKQTAFLEQTRQRFCA
jgi:hypothetical protein